MSHEKEHAHAASASCTVPDKRAQPLCRPSVSPFPKAGTRNRTPGIILRHPRLLLPRCAPRSVFSPAGQIYWSDFTRFGVILLDF